MKCSSPGGRALIDAHFAGRISPARERELRAHLPGCTGCREYYDGKLLLSQLDPAALGAEDRLSRGLGLSQPANQSRTLSWGLGLAAMAASLWAIVPVRGAAADEFAARGSAVGTLDPALFVYQVEGGQASKLSGKTLGSAAELAFAYANPGGYERLVIFGVDEHRHVYWYHPEWSHQSDDPRPLTIASGSGVHEIPEAISHPYDGDELTIVALFSNEDLSVREIEHLLQSEKSIDALPLGAGVMKTIRLEVTR